MLWFKCKHPAERLVVEKKETIEQIDDDFDVITYNLQCGVCKTNIKVTYARLRNGISGFMRAEKK